jgi:pyruvate formate lyase activating enzyme
MTTRRTFLSAAARGVPLLGGASVFGWSEGFVGAVFATTALDRIVKTAPVARYWTSVARAGGDCAVCHGPGSGVEGQKPRHPSGLVHCQLCARQCDIRPGERGMCRARMNVGGELRSLVYGHPVAIHIDPIEKKPFFHFLPGCEAFSLATAGCPLRCRFCQNWEISQSSPEDHPVAVIPPARIAAEAMERKAPVVAFTYNEPTVFTEYMVDVATAARRTGRRCVLVSCGFMNEAPLDEMCDNLAAIKIDLKGFSKDFYHNVCRAELDPVLRSIRQVHKRGVHLEIVNLVVPTLNDSEAMLRGLATWVAQELGPDVPIHFTRFHPDYQLQNLPPTPVETLERARAIALAHGIHYPYVGNVPGHPGNSTYCPKCGKIVIQRTGFFVVANHVAKGRCSYCGEPIAGVWE